MAHDDISGNCSLVKYDPRHFDMAMDVAMDIWVWLKILDHRKNKMVFFLNVHIYAYIIIYIYIDMSYIDIAYTDINIYTQPATNLATRG